eukprot:Skav205709  [mRNA]  locus=scaffold608:28158:28439:+ [translate_table: standard]
MARRIPAESNAKGCGPCASKPIQRKVDCCDNGSRPLDNFSCLSTSKREKCSDTSSFLVLLRALNTQNSSCFEATIATISIGIAKTPMGMKAGE